MKANNVRIDERLIHGQVATMWTNTLGCNRIIVANDAAVKSETDIAILKMACPTGVSLSISSVSKAVVNINAGKYPDGKFFLIFKNVADCKRALDEGLDADVVVVGNVSHKVGSKKLKNNISFLPEEIEDAKAIVAKGVKLVAKMVPNDPSEDIMSLIK